MLTKHRPQLQTDVFDVAPDQKYSRELTAMVVATQSVGLLLIGLGLGLLRELHHTAYIVITSLVVGALFLAGWCVYCWYDAFLNLITSWSENIRAFEPIPDAKRKTRVLRATFALIVADMLLLAVLIVLTGGPGQSPLDPLLPIIPIIAIILKQPRRTILVALGLSFVVIGLFLVHFICDALDLVAHSHEPAKWIHDSHSDKGYPVAFGVVAGGAIALSFIEFVITHQRPFLAKGIRSVVATVVESSDARLQGLTRSIKRGSNTWVKWLAHRDLPTADLSLVHSEEDVIKQAVILVIPYWIDGSGFWFRNRTRKRIARHVAFLTLAAHWIDDHFDALGQYCNDQALKEQILMSSPEEILRAQHPRLQELLKRMERLAYRKNRTMVKRAVIRIIYGGLIQNAQSKERLRSLQQDYVEYVGQYLFGNQLELYRELLASRCPQTALLSAKVVMELLDCCTKGYVARQTEFFNLLYGPILYYHNCEDELVVEKYGSGFGGSITDIQMQLPEESDLLQLIEKCASLIGETFGETGLPTGRRVQLEFLLRLYKTQLPEKIVKAYRQLLDSDMALKRQHKPLLSTHQASDVISVN